MTGLVRGQFMFERVENEIAIAERHLQVLAVVGEQEPVGLVTLTNRLSYPRHKIRYALLVLEADDLVESTEPGVTTTAHTSDFWSTVDRRVRAVQQTLAELRSDDSPFSSATIHSMATD